MLLLLLLSCVGNFWIHRFRDAWDSCTHKKAVALSVFGLVWNLSSVVARIWAGATSSDLFVNLNLEHRNKNVYSNGWCCVNLQCSCYLWHSDIINNTIWWGMMNGWKMKWGVMKHGKNQLVLELERNKDVHPISLIQIK